MDDVASQIEKLKKEVEQARAASDLPEEVKQALRAMDNFEYQDENGVDLTLIRDNLKLTPTQRLERNLQHRLETQEIRRHARRIA